MYHLVTVVGSVSVGSDPSRDSKESVSRTDGALNESVEDLTTPQLCCQRRTKEGNPQYTLTNARREHYFY